MPGSLYLGCGSAADEAPLWRAMLRGRTTRIVYWPFALPPGLAAAADRWLRENLDGLEVDYRLDTWPDLDHRDPSELTGGGVDLLFVGGGNTFQLLDAVRRHRFLEPVRAFWAAGGDYYGGSAGAVLAGETIGIAEGLDPNDCGLTDLASLGLLRGPVVLPHFTEQQLPDGQRWSAQHGVEVLGLPEPVGLQCTDGRATVLGRGELVRISGDVTERFGPGESFGLGTR